MFVRISAVKKQGQTEECLYLFLPGAALPPSVTLCHCTGAHHHFLEQPGLCSSSTHRRAAFQKVYLVFHLYPRCQAGQAFSKTNTRWHSQALPLTQMGMASAWVGTSCVGSPFRCYFWCGVENILIFHFLLNLSIAFGLSSQHRTGSSKHQSLALALPDRNGQNLPAKTKKLLQNMGLSSFHLLSALQVFEDYTWKL